MKHLEFLHFEYHRPKDFENLTLYYHYCSASNSILASKTIHMDSLRSLSCPEIMLGKVSLYMRLLISITAIDKLLSVVFRNVQKLRLRCLAGLTQWNFLALKWLQLAGPVRSRRDLPRTSIPIERLSVEVFGGIWSAKEAFGKIPVLK